MFVRYASAIGSGSFVTLGLFYVMQSLISLQPGIIEEPLQNGSLIFTRLIEERSVETKPLQQRFESLREPVDLTPSTDERHSDYDGLTVRTPLNPTLPKSGLDQLTGFVQDGPLVAIVRVSPVYPTRASSLDLEGFVIVQFDVNADGTVSNLSIIESSHRLFEKSALDAAGKFRFKARVVDGVSRPTYGIQNLFRFELERG